MISILNFFFYVIVIADTWIMDNFLSFSIVNRTQEIYLYKFPIDCIRIVIRSDEVETCVHWKRKSKGNTVFFFCFVSVTLNINGNCVACSFLMTWLVTGDIVDEVMGHRRSVRHLYYEIEDHKFKAINYKYFVIFR